MEARLEVACDARVLAAFIFIAVLLPFRENVVFSQILYVHSVFIHICVCAYLCVYVDENCPAFIFYAKKRIHIAFVHLRS